MTVNANDSAVSRSPKSNKAFSKDWVPFAEKLAKVLSQMEEGQYLIVSARNCNRFVQFACQGEWGMRVEVTSNHFLKGKERLSRRQTAWLCSHGWNAPSGNRKQATPEKDPDGSPNFYFDFPALIHTDEITRQAAEAFAYGLAISHPARLVYEAFDDRRNSLTFEGLPIKEADQEGPPLMERVLEVFRNATGIADLELDIDGDISISYGKIGLYTKAMPNKLRLITPLITDMVESPGLLSYLNQINLRPHAARCALKSNMIFAISDIPTSPFNPKLVAAGLDEFAKTSEVLAMELRSQFSGNGHIDAAAPSNHIQ